MPDMTSLAARYAGRPLLLTPTAARELALRVQSADPRAFERPGRVEAFLRRVGLSHGRRGARAMDDDDLPPPVPMEQRLAYQPRWLGEVEDVGFCWSLSQGVALMSCDSPLVERGDEFCGVVWHGYDTLLQATREALADTRVRGLFLRLDTPGGVVGGGLPALAAFLRGAREAAGGKPIWVFADMACSAGYWIAAQADRILAPSVGYVGSIGAVMVHESFAGMLEQDGVEISTIEFPEGGVKTDGAWWKALSESARAAWQADVNQIGALFLADVEAGRSALSAERLTALRADAFMAEHQDAARSGLALGLVDEIADEETAFAALVEHVSQPASNRGTTPEGPMATRTTPRASTPAPNASRRPTRAETPAAEGVEEEEEGEGTAEAASDEPEPAAGGTSEDVEEDQGDAQAIAASAEARSHPHLALAAIQSGQTLAQFRANVSASGSGGRASRLDRAMAGASRLAADGGAAAGVQGLGGVLLKDAQRRSGSIR